MQQEEEAEEADSDPHTRMVPPEAHTDPTVDAPSTPEHFTEAAVRIPAAANQHSPDDVSAPSISKAASSMEQATNDPNRHAKRRRKSLSATAGQVKGSLPHDVPPLGSSSSQRDAMVNSASLQASQQPNAQFLDAAADAAGAVFEGSKSKQEHKSGSRGGHGKSRRHAKPVKQRRAQVQGGLAAETMNE